VLFVAFLTPSERPLFARRVSQEYQERRLHEGMVLQVCFSLSFVAQIRRALRSPSPRHGLAYRPSYRVALFISYLRRNVGIGFGLGFIGAGVWNYFSNQRINRTRDYYAQLRLAERKAGIE
jgi:hypothetical protein